MTSSTSVTRRPATSGPSASLQVPYSLAFLRTNSAGVPVFAYGNFITVAVNFLILAFIVFLMVRAITRMTEANKAPEAAPATPEDTVLLREIRDSLKAKG